MAHARVQDRDNNSICDTGQVQDHNGWEMIVAIWLQHKHSLPHGFLIELPILIRKASWSIFQMQMFTCKLLPVDPCSRTIAIAQLNWNKLRIDV